MQTITMQDGQLWCGADPIRPGGHIVLQYERVLIPPAGAPRQRSVQRQHRPRLPDKVLKEHEYRALEAEGNPANVPVPPGGLPLVPLTPDEAAIADRVWEQHLRDVEKELSAKRHDPTRPRTPEEEPAAIREQCEAQGAVIEGPHQQLMVGNVAIQPGMRAVYTSGTTFTMSISGLLRRGSIPLRGHGSSYGPISVLDGQTGAIYTGTVQRQGSTRAILTRPDGSEVTLNPGWKADVSHAQSARHFVTAPTLPTAHVPTAPPPVPPVAAALAAVATAVAQAPAPSPIIPTATAAPAPSPAAAPPLAPGAPGDLWQPPTPEVQALRVAVDGLQAQVHVLLITAQRQERALAALERVVQGMLEYLAAEDEEDEAHDAAETPPEAPSEVAPETLVPLRNLDDLAVYGGDHPAALAGPETPAETPPSRRPTRSRRREGPVPAHLDDAQPRETPDTEATA